MLSFSSLFLYVFIIGRASSSSNEHCILSQDSSHLYCSSKQITRTIILLEDIEKKNVTDIDFSHNDITEIEFLSKWYPNVRALNFDGNSITKIEIDAFANLTYLEDINLSFNSLTEIPTFTFVHNKLLKRVSLSGNKQIVFDKDKPILCSSSLEKLDISHTSLEVVTKNNLMCLPSVNDLNLSYNSLSTLSPDVFLSMPLLKSVYLANNYFPCNCKLLKLVKWLSNKKSDITGNTSCIMEWKTRTILGNTTNQLNCSEETSNESIITQNNIVQEASVYILYYNVSQPFSDKEIRCSRYVGFVHDDMVYTLFPFVMLALVIVSLVAFRFYSAKRSADSMYVSIYDTKTDHRFIPVHIKDHTYMHVK